MSERTVLEMSVIAKAGLLALAAVLLLPSMSANADSSTVTVSDRLPFSSTSRHVMIFVRLAG